MTCKNGWPSIRRVACLPSRRTKAQFQIWGVNSGTLLSPILDHEVDQYLTFNGDASVLATAGEDGMVRLWSVATAQNSHLLCGVEGVGQLRRFYAPGAACSFPPVMTALSAAGTRNAVQEQFSFPLGSPVLRRLVFSPDGAFLAAGCRDGRIAVWDLKANAVAAEFRHERSVLAVLLSQNGQKLAWGGGGRTVRVPGALKSKRAAAPPLVCAAEVNWVELINDGT